MAAAGAMRLNAAPTRRHDIISAILSDYGDSRDRDDDDADADVELDDYYTQAHVSPAAPPAPVPGAAAALPVQSASVSPVAKDKPLPPLVGFQVRAVPDAPAASQPGAPSEELNMVISGSRSFRGRRQKPPDLKLARSNGSTALTPANAATPAKTDTNSLLPSLTSGPLPQHLPTPDRVRAHATARLLDELPLPPTPPPPPAKNDARRPSTPTTSAAGAAAMGNKASKAAGDASSPSHRSKFSLRRKPVRKDALPPAADANGALKAPAQGDLASGGRVAAAQAPASLAAPAVQNSKSNTSLQQSVTAGDSQLSAPQSEPNHHSQSLSTTLSEATVARDRSNSPPTEPEDEEPITPTLKPAVVDLLPSPSPVPEESPSKYGVVKKPSNPAVEKQKATMHYRGKSSTGFDIFKSSTNKLQNTMPYMTIHAPPISPKPASVSNITSPMVNSPTELSSLTVASPTMPAFEFFNAQIRPERTIVPRLNCIHVQCFHQHRRFHRSNNHVLPVGCMLCFSSSPDFCWTCTWCALRICQGCRVKIESLPYKSLDIFIRERVGEKSAVDTAVTRNKENLLVQKKRKSMHEPNKVVVWET